MIIHSCGLNVQAVLHRPGTASLTPRIATTYRWQVASGVDGCRMSTDTPPFQIAADLSHVGSGRGWAVPGRHAACSQCCGRRQSISCRRRAGWTFLETNGENREQAYVSAEQPPPSPHARFPPPHAHSRRSRHLVRAPPQGPQEPRRLSHRVLPRSQRLTDGESFRRTTRRGRRSTSATLVVHLLLDAPQAPHSGSARVGFVVGRGVGNAVVRNRTRRRLRHLAKERLGELPPGSMLVVRALPAAADASSSRLGRDLDRCLTRQLESVGAGRP